MSTPLKQFNPHEPAFATFGLTKREQMFICVLQGLVSNPDHTEATPVWLADRAWSVTAGAINTIRTEVSCEQPSE